MSKILICNRQIIESIEKGRSYNFDGFEVIFEDPFPNQQVTHEQLLEISHSHPNIEGVIIGDEEFNKIIIDSFENLKIISKWGQGMDNINREYAETKNIPVLNTPGLLANSVADLVVGYVLVLLRGIIETHQSVLEGKWPKTRGIELFGKTVSIIGLGNIGRNIVKRLYGFGVKFKGYDPYPPKKSFVEKYTVELCDSEKEAISRSDIVIICCNLTDKNYKFMNKEMFSLLNQAYLVNVGRGMLIDESDLVEAIKRGHIAGAALDVYETEPLPEGSELRKLENVVFGTHSAGQTTEAVEEVNKAAIKNLDPLRS